MVAETKFFGTIDIEDDKIINFPNGIIGFENLKNFALIYDSEREERSKISWLQSMEEPLMVLPVINPLDLMDNYTPTIEDELMKNIGDPADADLLIFVTLSIPSDIELMTANLKAPFIINTVERKAMQVIVENAEYPVKFNAYQAIQAMKEKGGE
ncbi:MAG: flagellar assembly protein FliW [Lachnospiraceae bacterium]|nr:flagellar assembly protein FliW [Lachnospiraceae bacterium]MBQ8317820.1 flagellar assembly protein FliW [Lachnospiraceae bacterium]